MSDHEKADPKPIHPVSTVTIITPPLSPKTPKGDIEDENLALLNAHGSEQAEKIRADGGAVVSSESMF